MYSCIFSCNIFVLKIDINDIKIGWGRKVNCSSRETKKAARETPGYTWGDSGRELAPPARGAPRRWCPQAAVGVGRVRAGHRMRDFACGRTERNRTTRRESIAESGIRRSLGTCAHRVVLVMIKTDRRRRRRGRRSWHSTQTRQPWSATRAPALHRAAVTE